MKALLLFMLLPLSGWAQQDPLTLREDELDPSSEDVLIRQPEKYLRNESMIYDLNSDLGIRDQRKYTGTDRNRFSIAGHLSSDYEHFTNILGGEVAYMRRSQSFSQIWWGAQLFQHRTFFDAITTNPRSGGPNSEAATPRPGNVKNTVMGFGPGVGYRFKLLTESLPSEEWFENIDVFINAIQLDETFVGKKYQGWGLTTNYGIHKRSSTSFFYGGKFSYNIASVTREAIADESKSERSLSLGWLSVAFELGFFF